LGKSGLKALQYMALEIPTVAERVGANLEIIRDGENGFLPSSPAEWLEVLRRLVRDADLRKRTGERGRETVQERYSVRANAPAYLQVLRSALRGDGECAG
jgi:glycosyltransferase involved in cell wall biosynthesis